MTETEAFAYYELAAAVKREEEAVQSARAADAAARAANDSLTKARIERCEAHDKLLQLARSSA